MDPKVNDPVATVTEAEPDGQANGNDGHDGMTRREFVQTSAMVGGAAVAATSLPWAVRYAADAATLNQALAQAADGYPLNDPKNILHTSCLQCNTGCTIKVKLVDGVVSKIDGSPFGPLNFWPHLPYETSPLETGTIDGWVCPKGQSGIQTTYDPYRIRRVLKRKGKRGEQQWESIPFEQAVEEIVSGTTFPTVPPPWGCRTCGR